MNAETHSGPTAGEVVDEAGAVLAGLGMITMVLFPFALPAIILAGVALVPLVVIALVAAALAAVIAPPILAVRGLRRRSRSRREGVADRERARASGSLSAPPPARVGRP